MIKSEIIYTNNDNDNIDSINSLKCKARLLYFKYIDYGSNYKIDLDFNVRQSIINIMEIPDEWDKYKINGKEILHFFDNVIEDIFKSLISSFARFKKSKKYQQRNN